MATKQATKFAASSARLSYKKLAQLIVATGHEISTVILGHTGSGKTTLGSYLSELTGFPLVYFDCTTKSLEDLGMPALPDGHNSKCFRMVPNEELGLHYDRPVVLMFDEINKNRAIVNGVNRVLLERQYGSFKLHPQTIVIGTSNLGAEGMGDTMMPHTRNRVRIIEMLKPSAKEWIEDYAQPKNLHPALIAVAHEFPQMFDAFTDVENPSDNPYIFDPRDSSRTSFVTHRSFSRISVDLVARDKGLIDDEILLQGMIGLVGPKAAHDIMTMVSLGDTLPSHESIVADPAKAKLPTSVGAKIMVAIRSVQRVEQEEFANVFKYMQRLPMETTALFATALLKHKAKGVWVSRQSAFTEFATKNFQLFQK